MSRNNEDFEKGSSTTWKWEKDDAGDVTATCNDCGRMYSKSSAWDMANIDWHEH